MVMSGGYCCLQGRKNDVAEGATQSNVGIIDENLAFLLLVYLWVLVENKIRSATAYIATAPYLN